MPKIASNVANGGHTPITKFLPSGGAYSQLPEPFTKKSAGGYTMHGGVPDFGGQDSIGTQHSTNGSHQRTRSHGTDASTPARAHRAATILPPLFSLL